MPIKSIVIGSGFSGLSAATTLAQAGHEVQVLEKNSQFGGRAGIWKHQGFIFDMGPSWYWMPDVFENYFNNFNRKVSDYYDLIRLDPSYRVFFNDRVKVDIPASLDKLVDLFNSLEKGAGEQLLNFLKEAEIKYGLGMKNLVYKPGLSISEFATWDVFKNLFKLNIFQSFHGYIRKYFKNPQILQLLEFPVLFLGAAPKSTPALYSLMNYADVKLGTWYPRGGMNKIVTGMVELAKEMGVEFQSDTEALNINVKDHRAFEVETSKKNFQVDNIVGAADYNHIEQVLLKSKHRNYNKAYWNKKSMSPSCLIFYVGVKKKVNNLLHHNLFFDEDFNQHAKELYEAPEWPSKPLFYVCCPSKTDSSVAPEGCENLFILIPVASGLDDSEMTRDKYFNLVINRIENKTGDKFNNDIIFKRSYAHSDFISDYNSFKGNAYGLANTLRQTAILKPKLRNKYIKNLFYAGQLTVPGPGVPPALISGQIAANQIIKNYN